MALLAIIAQGVAVNIVPDMATLALIIGFGFAGRRSFMTALTAHTLVATGQRKFRIEIVIEFGV